MMRLTDQSPAQTRAAPAVDQVPAAATAAQAEAQLEATIQKAVQEGLKGGRVSADLKAEIRATIQAARDAAQEGMPPQPPPLPPPGDFGSGRGDAINNDIPPQVPEIMSILGLTLVFCIVGLPIARAFARWIDRRGHTPPAPAREVMTRLEAIEQAVESVAVEVERISEGQRFTTRVLSERVHEPAPEFLPAREPAAVGTPVNARRS